MSSDGERLYEFGPYRLDPALRLLFRDQTVIPLQPKAFELLLVLVENTGRLLLKDDLLQAVWPGTFVEESNLAQNIFLLRKALGESAGERRYIITVSGRGYRFAESVRVIEGRRSNHSEPQTATHDSPSALSDPPTNGRGDGRGTQILATEPPRNTETALPAAVSVKTARAPWLWSGMALLAVSLLLAGVFLLRPTVPPPRVLRVRQLTHIGTVIPNVSLVTDGPRVYFRAWEGRERVIRYVSPEGGEIFPIQKAFPAIDIEDISPDGAEFLAVDLGDPLTSDRPPPLLWRVPVPQGSPRSVGSVGSRDARWSPDGQTIAYVSGADIWVVNIDGSDPRKVVTLPGVPFRLQWAPDGRHLRVALADPTGNGVAIWQVDLSTQTAQPLLPDWPRTGRASPGRWTPDGRYFFFTAQSESTTDLWAIREKPETWRRVSHQPVQLTEGPLLFHQPTPSKDGKMVFAVGRLERGQLLQYDAASRQYMPYGQGPSVDQVSFSRDGQWMAYVEYPQGILVRSRVDGSDRRQLTFPPMRVLSPQWSPDGTQVAFQAKADSAAPNKIYVVSWRGGAPVLATPERSDRQVYPSWAPDGSAILFSGSDQSGNNSSLYQVDIKAKLVAQLPGSEGLYWGQISPDGRSIAALTESGQKLVLYDSALHKTRLLAGLADYPKWSADGKFLYFSTLYFHGRLKDAGIFRWRAATNKVEKVADSPDFLLGGLWGIWFGLTPSGAPLVVRDLTSSDLYALDVQLP